jgi:hypothetical protein
MTLDDYMAGVEWVAFQRPNHPLLDTLQAGMSPINEMYLKHVLKSVGEPQEIEQEEDQLVQPDDPQLIIMQKERRDLFIRRARLSNQFHDCRTDSERALVSDDIRVVQKQIGALLRRIHVFKTTGELPDLEEQEGIPENGVALMRRKHSVRTNISHKERSLRQSMHKKGEQWDKKRAKWEKRLKELRHELVQIERKIASQSI